MNSVSRTSVPIPFTFGKNGRDSTEDSTYTLSCNLSGPKEFFRWETALTVAVLTYHAFNISGNEAIDLVKLSNQEYGSVSLVRLLELKAAKESGNVTFVNIPQPIITELSFDDS